jgi:hypothetical protein
MTKSSNGLQRTPSGRASPVSARAAARKPGRSNLSVSSVPKIASSDTSSFDDEARAQNAALIDELKEQLQKAETASEQYQKQLGVLQSRLDDAITEQQKLEDQVHERDSNIEALNTQIRDHARQLRDMEQAHEQERNAMLQDKEQQASREEELQSTIQRLKESIAQKDIRVNTDSDKSNISRSCTNLPIYALTNLQTNHTNTLRSEFPKSVFPGYRQWTIRSIGPDRTQPIAKQCQAPVTKG